jgi:glutathione synthase/RimK-type ligase-like ATP-grasp enzyme
MRILLSDGSGLTARQAAGLLAVAGHDVGVLSADPWCLCRFTGTVRRVHPVPAVAADPFAWLDAALAVYRDHAYDALLPTQEQAAVLSWAASRVHAAGVVTAVPPFTALAAVQDKVRATGTLAALGLPQPRTVVVDGRAALATWARFPVWVKAAVGTATSGVWLVPDATTRDRIVDELPADSPLVVQDPAPGPLVMVQAVAAGGRLVAFHAAERRREGARGGASHKVGVLLPAVRRDMATLVEALDWHGALSADVIMTPDGHRFIDVNPRLVEPVNGFRSGVDLVGALLAVACNQPVASPGGRAGVATHQLLLAVLGAAGRRGRRRDVVAELAAAARRRGAYRGSTEELTPLAGDLRAAVPVALAAAVALARPGAAAWLTRGGVGAYALSAAGWEALVGADR